MRVKIFVTKDDINKGCRGDDLQCPVAKAILKIVKPNISVSVGGNIVLSDNQYNRVSCSNIKVSRFVQKFDNREKVNPLSFTVRIPKKFLRQSVINKFQKVYA